MDNVGVTQKAREKTGPEQTETTNTRKQKEMEKPHKIGNFQPRF